MFYISKLFLVLQAWESSVWMNSSEMGLIEDTDHSQDIFTSIIYVHNAAARDVGRYRYEQCSTRCEFLDFIFSCVDVNEDVVDIDSPQEMSLYVFVNSENYLTNIDADTMLMVTMTSDSETLIPCTPIMPHTTVHLLVDDQDISHNYMFDPKQGFILQE